MPAIAAHYYFGQEVYDQLPNKIKNTIDKSKDAFDLGLQGPDIFFYYQPYKKNIVEKFGQNLHKEQVFNFIEKAVTLLKNKSNKYIFSYLLGFSCHFILDSSCHSLINKLAPSTIEHFQLETELDRMIIEKNGFAAAESFKRWKLIPACEKIPQALALIYQPRTKAEIDTAIKSMVFYSRLLYSPRGIKKGLLLAIEKCLGKTGLFTSLIIAKKPYERYTEPAREIMPLYDLALDEAVLQLENIYVAVKEDIVLSERLKRTFE